MNTNLNNVIRNFACRSVRPLLLPYDEGGLSASEQARVRLHLAGCLACSAESDALTAVSALLRNPPTAEVCLPKADLWAGIEAEIRRTGAGSDDRVFVKRRPGLAPGFLWPSGIPVAVAVFSAVVFAFALVDARHVGTTVREADGSGSIALTLRHAPTSDRVAMVRERPVALIANGKMPTPVASRRADDPVRRSIRSVVAVNVPAGRYSARSVFLALAEVHHALAVARPQGTNGSARLLLLRDSNKLSLHAPKPPIQVAFVERRSEVTAPIVSDGSLSLATAGSISAAASDGDPAEMVGGGGGLPEPGHGANVVLASYEAVDEGDAALRNAPTSAPMADMGGATRRQHGLFSYGPR